MSCRLADAVAADPSLVAVVRIDENAATRDQAAARQLARQLKDAQAPNTSLPTTYAGDTNGINHFIVDGCTNFNFPSLDVFDPTTWTVPKKESTASSESRMSAPEDRKTGFKVRADDKNSTHSGQGPLGVNTSSNRRADEDNDIAIGKATTVTKFELRTSGKKRVADEYVVLDSERPRKRAKLNTFTGPEDPVPDVKKTCVCCGEPVNYFATLQAPCGHDYCSQCAKKLVSMSTTDDSLFPPRCCRQPIPLAAVDAFMSAGSVQYFEERAVENSTANKTYCAKPTCSAFIPPSSINGDIATCPKCSFQICITCKEASHEGCDCPKDTALNEVIELAQQAGWKRCYECKRVVELTEGCNHITYVSGLTEVVAGRTHSVIGASAMLNGAMFVKLNGNPVNVPNSRKETRLTLRTKWPIKVNEPQQLKRWLI